MGKGQETQINIHTIAEAEQHLAQMYNTNNKGQRLESDSIGALGMLQQIKYVRFNNIHYFWNTIANDWECFISIDTIDNYIKSIHLETSIKSLNNILKRVNAIIFSGLISINWITDERIFYFRNGIVNLNYFEDEEGFFTEMNSKVYSGIPIKYINYDYKPYEKTSEASIIMHNLLRRLAKGDEKELTTILTMLGVIANNIRIEHFFNFYGVEASGKSTLLDIARQLVSKGDSVSTSLNSLNTRFGLIPLIGKKLLFNGDASKETIDEGILKELTTTGQEFTIEVKGVNIHWFQTLPLNIIIVSNNKLTFKSMEGTSRRYILISFPFGKKYKGEHFSHISDEDFKKVKKIQGNTFNFTKKAMESIIPMILTATRTFLNNNKVWEFSDMTKEALGDALLHNDNILQWWDDYELVERFSNETLYRDWADNKASIYIKTSLLYTSYNQYCVDSGLKAKGKNTFLTGFLKFLSKKGFDAENNKSINGAGKNFAISKRSIIGLIASGNI